MATYHVNIAELTQGIADKIAALKRALRADEMYEYITDHIVGKYPNITVGELDNFRREVIKAISKYQEAQQFESQQRAKRDQWKQFENRQPYTRFNSGRWNDSQEDIQQPYGFKFKVNADMYERMTGHKWEEPEDKTNYANYVKIPGLTGWSAPADYNKYHGGTGAFKYCRPFRIKGRLCNADKFELIPFQFIPSSLCL